MKKLILMIFLVTGCLSTFATKHKSKKKSKAGNEITSVSMHRTACFGKCPDYIIEINATGMATYTAFRFCEDSGIYKKNIGAAKAMEVINQFTENRIDTCKDQYENRIPDLPGIVLTIKYKSTTKTIYNAHFGPPFLRRLAEAMDAAGKKTDKSWKFAGYPKQN